MLQSAAAAVPVCALNFVILLTVYVVVCVLVFVLMCVLMCVVVFMCVVVCVVVCVCWCVGGQQLLSPSMGRETMTPRTKLLYTYEASTVSNRRKRP